MIPLALLAALAASPPPLACPRGTEHKGLAPPEGYEEWCETPADDPRAPKQREGPAPVYYDDGSVWVEESYAAGLRDGAFVEWHRNGKKAREGRFVHGLKDGRWTVWRESGLVEEESGWRAGVPEGRFVAYFANGKPRSEGRHCGGAQCGRWNAYDEGGRLLGTVDYGEQTQTP